MLNNNSKNKILAVGKSAAKKAKPMNVLKYVDTVKHLYDDAPPPKPKPNSNIIDLHPYLTDEWWNIKPEPEDEA
jgi:hypothetical protein